MPNEPFEIVEHPAGRATRTSRTTSSSHPRGTTGPATSATGSPENVSHSGTTRTQPAGAGATESAGTPSAAEPSTAGQVEQQRRIEELDDIVDRFRSDRLSKPKALALLFRTIGFDPDSSDPSQEQALTLYLSAINSHEEATRESLRRGAPYGGSPGEEGEVAGELLEPRRDPEVDRRINDLVSELSAKSVAADPGDDDDGDRPTKRARLSLSDMPWYKDELDGRDSGNPICQKNRELLALFSRDIPQVKFWIRNSALAPVDASFMHQNG